MFELIKEIPEFLRNFKYLNRSVKWLLTRPVEANLIDKFENETYNVQELLLVVEIEQIINGIVPVTIL